MSFGRIFDPLNLGSSGIHEQKDEEKGSLMVGLDWVEEPRVELVGAAKLEGGATSAPISGRLAGLLMIMIG